MFKAWWNIAMLAVETQQALWQRSMGLAVRGAAAPAEGQRMVSEKLAVAAPAAAGALVGDSAVKTVKRDRKKVRANRRRMSK